MAYIFHHTEKYSYAMTATGVSILESPTNAETVVRDSGLQPVFSGLPYEGQERHVQ